MANLDLSGQRADVETWLPAFTAFRSAMDQRLTIWNKLDHSQRRRWLRAAAGTPANPKTLAESKDPVMWLAVYVFRYFRQIEIQEPDA